ncbi:MAG: ATP-binding protein [Gemmatimonadaceae bacterium]
MSATDSSLTADGGATTAPPRRSVGLRDWALWLGALLVATALLHHFRGRLDKAHVALVFVLVVLGGSAAAGRRVGISLALLSFLAFDYFFLPPFGTIIVADPLDWLVLVTFLVTGIVAAQLLERLRREAETARARADEISRLAKVRDEAEVLRRADRLKDALLAAVSHDLRTPLTTIKGIAHEIVGGANTERAEIIEAEADRLSHLVDDLLEMSQLDAGALPLDTALNTADDVIGAALQRTQVALQGRIVDVELPDGAILVGRFDFSHALRVLTNLLENASKYSPALSAIVIRAGRRGDWLEFAVEDTGPGIPDDERERVFEPFRRGSIVPDGVRGAGLGLSIARRLAEVQGGSLRYEPREGGGSRFVFTVPGAEEVPLE